MLRLISMFFPRENISPGSCDYSGKGRWLCQQCELINWAGVTVVAVVLQMVSSLPGRPVGIGDRVGVGKWYICGKTIQTLSW